MLFIYNKFWSKDSVRPILVKLRELYSLSFLVQADRTGTLCGLPEKEISWAFYFKKLHKKTAGKDQQHSDLPQLSQSGAQPLFSFMWQ